MTKGRDKVAERLGDIVDVIRSRQHSGLLSIERFEAGRFEEGEIYFQQGRPIYARVGNRVGQDALNWLSGWRQIYFNFSTNVPRPDTNVVPAVRPPDMPAHSLSETSPVLPLPPTSGVGFGPPSQFPPPAVPPPFPPMGPSVALPSDGRNGTEGAEVGLQALDVPGAEHLVPRRIETGKNVLSLPLTRPQRSIYLLLDGRRSVSDLARFTRKSVPEIRRLLSELREHGLIVI